MLGVIVRCDTPSELSGAGVRRGPLLLELANFRIRTLMCRSERHDSVGNGRNFPQHLAQVAGQSYAAIFFWHAAQ